MANKVFGIFFGLLCIYLGVMLIKYPIFFDSRHGVMQDFSQIKWPLGGGFIFIGICFLGDAIRKKNNKKIVFICPKCEEVVEHKETKDIQCPVCATRMEPLKGFYESHPELKEK